MPERIKDEKRIAALEAAMLSLLRGEAEYSARDMAIYGLELVAEVRKARRIVRRAGQNRYRARRTTDLPACLSDLAESLVEHYVPLRGQPCVYFLLKDGQLAYIGQTVTLDGRLNQHLCDGKDFDRVVYMKVPADEITAREKELIRRFVPPLNVNLTPRQGRPREIGS